MLNTPASGAVAETRIGASPRKAPPPATAWYSSPVAGLKTMPITGSPRSTSAMLMANSARPFTNELVPSIGSTTHSRSRPSRSGESFVSSESQP